LEYLLIMKKILLINQDQNFIADLQVKFARQCEILATDSYKTAYQLCCSVPIDLLVISLPFFNDKVQIKALKKLLTKLIKKKFGEIKKLLTFPELGDYQIEEFLKLGIAAILTDLTEIERWID
jgi:hypothetical protein